MDRLDYDFFYAHLLLGKWIDETGFYFADDPSEEEHFLGYLPEYDLPYWVGYCDIEDGTEFKTAEELVNAPIFDGRSLKERWPEVRIFSIWGLRLDEWLESCPHPFPHP